MILLDDSLYSVVNGIEEGRLLFDNMKKMIAYSLSSSVPVILPFVIAVVFQMPQPLSIALVFCMIIVTNLGPSLSLAFEEAEGDVLDDNLPRNPKTDHLINRKLISFAYLQIGVIKAAAGLFTYFYIMNDYGFTPMSLFGLAGIKSYRPLDTDVYSPFEPFKGNSCVDRLNIASGCEDH